jgi:3-methylcrotonyl-CoA carboxylase alpha subunit
MKTEHVLRAPQDGIVKRVLGSIGELVKEGKILVEFEEVEEKSPIEG